MSASQQAKRLTFTFEYEGAVHHAVASLTPTRSLIEFSGIPLAFEILADLPGHVRVELPTDRSGQCPAVSSDIREIPYLEAAIASLRHHPDILTA